MQLTGGNFIGSRESAARTRTFRGVDPATGAELQPPFHQATPSEIDAAATLAQTAFSDYSRRTAAERAGFLRAIAGELEAIAPELSARITAETRGVDVLLACI